MILICAAVSSKKGGRRRVICGVGTYSIFSPVDNNRPTRSEASYTTLPSPPLQLLQTRLNSIQYLVRVVFYSTCTHSNCTLAILRFRYLFMDKIEQQQTHAIKEVRPAEHRADLIGGTFPFHFQLVPFAASSCTMSIALSTDSATASASSARSFCRDFKLPMTSSATLTLSPSRTDTGGTAGGA